MLLLFSTTDKLSLISDSAATLDVVASFMDASNADPPVVKGSTSGPQYTAISSATTTDIVAAAASNVLRNVKSVTIRNKSATLSCGVTVQANRSGTLYEIHKAILGTGDMLEFIEGIGWFLTTSTAKLDTKLYVSADVINATTSMADVTGLTCAVKNGKKYGFEAHLIHANNASTTGSQFSINGPAMTNILFAEFGTVTASVTAAALSAGASATRDTSTAAQTTGSTANRLTIMSGGFEPSADGTFAVRVASEVAVAAGVTVRRGSWCRVFEVDN